MGRVERKRVKPNRVWVKAFICKLRVPGLRNTITDQGKPLASFPVREPPLMFT